MSDFATLNCILYESAFETLFLPSDVEPSEEDLAREESDPNFWISYGSTEVERSVYESAGFEVNGIRYSLASFDEVGSDTLFAMAGELLAH